MNINLNTVAQTPVPTNVPPQVASAVGVAKSLATLAPDALKLSPKAQPAATAECAPPKPGFMDMIKQHQGMIAGLLCGGAILGAPSFLSSAIASGSTLLVAGATAGVALPAVVLGAMFFFGAFSSQSPSK